MRLRHMLCLAAAAAAVVGFGLRSSHAAELFSPDVSFMKDAAQAGHYEVQAAKIALARSSNPRIADFARMMITDHEQLSQELSALARARDVELPADPSLMQRGKLTLLKGKEGEAFDADYAEQAAVKAHEDTIKLFEDYLKKGKDKEVMGFAQDALPLLRKHLQHAHTLADSMKTAMAAA